MPAYTLELVDWIETLAAQSNLLRSWKERGKEEGVKGAKISAPTTLLSFSPRFVSDVFATRLETASLKKLAEREAGEDTKKMAKHSDVKSMIILNFFFSFPPKKH